MVNVKKVLKLKSTLVYLDLDCIFDPTNKKIEIMKNIAKNTTAVEKVITKIKKGFHTSLFPCEETCGQIDLLYIDNGCTEYFTLNQNLRNSDRNSIFINKGEIRLKEDNIFLRVIELN